MNIARMLLLVGMAVTVALIVFVAWLFSRRQKKMAAYAEKLLHVLRENLASGGTSLSFEELYNRTFISYPHILECIQMLEDKGEVEHSIVENRFHYSLTHKPKAFGRHANLRSF